MKPSPEVKPRTEGRVLLIGAGFIGCHVAEGLSAAGIPTRLLSRSGLPLDLGGLSGVEVFAGDAGDPSLIADALVGVEHVFYCAGGLLPAQSNRRPILDISLTLPPLVALLETLRAHPGTGVTFLSSGGTVYGRPVRLPVDEEHPTDPITSYGILKLAGEKYLQMYAALYGVPIRILRCSNVYGERQPPDRGQGVVAAFLQRALNDEPVVVFGDGSIVRDYLYVGDLVRVMLELMPLPDGPSVVNVGSGRPASLNDLLGLIEDVTGTRVRVDRRPSRDFDVPAIVLDVNRLRRMVAFEPVPLRLGVERTWAWMSADKPAGAVLLP